MTSLLAVVGVLFIMAARIDKMATSAASENEQLGLAVETVVSQIKDALATDVPGLSTSQEYYDYPDVNNPWLADLEPRQSGTDYRWRHITNLTGGSQADFNVPINVIGERDRIDLATVGTNADADGDGVGDALWYQLPGVMSSKGKPVYAAVRIIDNGSMLNLNTGWATPAGVRLDGSSPLQINVAALAVPGGSLAAIQAAAKTLQLARTSDADDGTNSLPAYESGVIWQYLPLPYDSPYTPFDVSDELELRYRFLLDHAGTYSRAEAWGHFNDSRTLSTPVDSSGAELRAWAGRATAFAALDPNYAYRHIATTYNMDRILTPRPIVVNPTRTLNRMVNVNKASQADIYQAVWMGLSERNPSDPNRDITAAQIAANLLDYVDDDNQVSVVPGPGGKKFYGFERPCVYISELAYRVTIDASTKTAHESYAIELYKPYPQDGALEPNQWQIRIQSGGTTSDQLIKWSGTQQFHVLLLQDAAASLSVDPTTGIETLNNGFHEGATISLQRLAGSSDWLTVDSKVLPAGFAPSTPTATDSNGVTCCLQRDISPYKCIRRLWSDPNISTPNFGNAVGKYVATDDSAIVQAFPANRPLINIGELGMVLARSGYDVPSGITADRLLVNLTNPAYAGLFNYLTVIDPAAHGQAPDESRIMGRVNINTAPWPVLDKLPWIEYPSDSPARAQAVVTYRDDHGPFKSVGDLMQVLEMRDLGGDVSKGDKHDGLENLYSDNPRGPDLTDDTALDDYEERDIIFTRLSDLVTVRSDVFTAYILVRLGLNGPQKRMVALLDRSTVSRSNTKVHVIALCAVADPR